MKDFTGLKGSLSDLKLVLEMEGLIPFNWRGNNLESFDPNVVNKFLKGIKEDEGEDIIKVIYYNFKSEKFEVGELFHRNHYWSENGDYDVSPFEGSKLTHETLAFRTSNEEFYFHIMDDKPSDLESLKLIGFDHIIYNDWKEFYSFDLKLKNPHEDEHFDHLDIGAYAGITPVLYYINMND